MESLSSSDMSAVVPVISAVASSSVSARSGFAASPHAAKLSANAIPYGHNRLCRVHSIQWFPLRYGGKRMAGAYRRVLRLSGVRWRRVATRH